MSHRQDRSYPAKRPYDGRDDRPWQRSEDGERRQVIPSGPSRGEDRGRASVYAPDKRARVDDERAEAGNATTAKKASVSFDASADKPSAQPQDEYDPDLTFELEDEETERKRIAEQRRKRQELLAKLSSESAASSSTTASSSASRESTVASASAPPQAQSSAQNIDFEVAKADRSAVTAPPTTSHNEVSAADYDPRVDRKVDEAREANRGMAATTAEVANGIGEPGPSTSKAAADDAESEYEEVEVEEEDDIDDMFSMGDPSDAPKKKKTIRVKKTARAAGIPASAGAAAHAGLTDNWDDDEGYYRIVLGERIGPSGRFHVFANLGKGMFSEVVRAKDLGPNNDSTTPTDVAIKIVRSQETMYKAGIKEIAHLEKLARLDVDDKRHVVRLVSHFEHRGHLCMVFENLNMNLREVVKRFGKDVGLNLKAVRAYAHQMFLGLALFKKAGIVHADVKPDNILVNEAKTTLKICDLGSAVDVTEMDLTPYLVSRFYRAPEIILGQPCDGAIDVWAVGCTLYELYTGRILFPGRSNNQMLQLMQEVKGRLTTKQIRRGQFSHLHYDETHTFLAHAPPTTKNPIGAASDGVDGFVAPAKRVVLSTSPVAGQDLKSRLASPAILRGLDEVEARRTQSFVDFLGRCLEVDPQKRITPQEALRHAFLAG